MEYGDYPTQREIPWKPIAIGAGALVLVIVLVVLIFRVIGSDDTLLITPEQDAVIEVETILDSCDNAEDVEGCLESGSKEAAILTGDTEYCGDLEESERDDCFLGAAREYMDLKACTAIVNEGLRTLCEDAVNRDLAVENDDSSFCGQLSSEEKIASCYSLFQEAVTANNCDELSDDADYCQMLKTAEEAAEKQDRSLCGSLEGEYVSSCKELVAIDDADFDGLETAQETEYGTDPYNSDTDGDGYDDKTEVDAGYNPAGEGRL